MAKVEINVPEVCAQCGSNNFNIYGTAYSKESPSVKIRICCMRWGNPTLQLDFETKNAKRVIK